MAALTAGGSAAAAEFDLRRPVSDRCLLHAFAALSVESHGMRPGSEIVAFLILAADGSLHLSRWPSNAAHYRETFTGTLPSGTVGIVHTHPLAWHHPSTGDVDEAVRLGLPNYVISRRIWVVDPESGESIELARAGWSRHAARVECEGQGRDGEGARPAGATETRRAE